MGVCYQCAGPAHARAVAIPSMAIISHNTIVSTTLEPPLYARLQPTDHRGLRAAGGALCAFGLVLDGSPLCQQQLQNQHAAADRHHTLPRLAAPALQPRAQRPPSKRRNRRRRNGLCTGYCTPGYRSRTSPGRWHRRPPSPCCHAICHPMGADAAPRPTPMRAPVCREQPCGQSPVRASPGGPATSRAGQCRACLLYTSPSPRDS